MRNALITPIRFYQRAISPAFGRRCKYHPTCSEYTVEAIAEFGAVRGTVLGAWRILRCNPFSRGGVDHPRDQRLFRS